MIIVSQDKNKTTESMELRICPNFKYTDADKDRIMNYIIVNQYSENFGAYETEERAKEVLQEISQRYTNWENLKVGQPSGICSPRYEMPLE